ncbi:MAG: hypothetical protein RLZZ437_2793 [Pseudomonadota bacterium]
MLDAHPNHFLRALELGRWRAVQIGGNNARELLSLTSLGITPARGIEQSPAFLDQARVLVAKAGLQPCLPEADIHALSGDVGTIDLALITIGVLLQKHG